LVGVAIMVNHLHLLVGVLGDPSPERVEGDFKSYGSRALSRRFGKPVSGTWWTASGSKRKLPDEKALVCALDYIRRQYQPLLLWFANNLASRGRQPPESGNSPGADAPRLA